jgi:hypothetical protein
LLLAARCPRRSRQALGAGGGVSIALPPSDIWRIFFEGVLVTKASILPVCYS